MIASIVNKRIGKAGIGFSLDEKRDEQITSPIDSDLLQYGFDRQFIGRIPNIAELAPLDEKALYEILRLPRSPVLETKRLEFAGYGIELTFDDAALHAIAEKSSHLGLGGRGLHTIVDGLLLDYRFHLPSTNIGQVRITTETVKDPENALRTLLSSSTPRRMFSNQVSPKEKTQTSPPTRPRMTLESYKAGIAEGGIFFLIP